MNEIDGKLFFQKVSFGKTLLYSFISSIVGKILGLLTSILVPSLDFFSLFLPAVIFCVFFYRVGKQATGQNASKINLYGFVGLIFTLAFQFVIGVLSYIGYLMAVWH